MKKRLILILGVMVLLPMAVLIGFGVVVARQEKERAQTRYEQILSGRLADINSGIAKLVQARERELLQALALTSHSPEAIRAQVRTQRLLRQLFVIGPSGDLIHPKEGGILTEEERAFLERTASLWKDGESFWKPAETNSKSPSKGKRGRRSNNVRLTQSYGWHTWFWGEGLRLIFWVRQEDGHIIGAEVERAAMMADIVGQLPVADSSRTPLPEGRIVLVDAQTRPLYQWGAYSPAKQAQSVVAQHLPNPFCAWTLQYFVPSGSIADGLGRSAIFNIISGLTVLCIALVAMAIYFYREHSRDMHEASRRVSFVNQVSHELKTPLTNIRMYAELLEKRIPDDDTRTHSYVGILVSETQRLTRLITNVLTFASHRRGKLRLHTQPAHIAAVVDAVIASFNPAFEAMGIAVSVEGSADRCVALDVDALEQILGNLINNVEKYATNATALHVRMQQDVDTTTITVSDDGGGIPDAQSETIFTPFVRLSNKLTDGVSGTGIGLSIARQLACLHGGNLILVSTESGATFELTLNTPELKP